MATISAHVNLTVMITSSILLPSNVTLERRKGRLYHVRSTSKCLYSLAPFGLVIILRWVITGIGRTARLPPRRPLLQKSKKKNKNKKIEVLYNVPWWIAEPSF